MECLLQFYLPVCQPKTGKQQPKGYAFSRPLVILLVLLSPIIHSLIFTSKGRLDIQLKALERIDFRHDVSSICHAYDRLFKAWPASKSTPVLMQDHN